MEKYLKKCTMDDFDVLRELSIRTYYETYAHLNTAEDMQAYPDEAFEINKLCGELDNSDSDFFLLYVNNTIAGYFKLNEAPSQTDVNIAAERNKKYVWLCVWEKNEKAIHLYEKNEFYETGTHSFVMGEDVQTDYIMRKDLI